MTSARLLPRLALLSLLLACGAPAQTDGAAPAATTITGPKRMSICQPSARPLPASSRPPSEKARPASTASRPSMMSMVASNTRFPFPAAAAGLGTIDSANRTSSACDDAGGT